MEGFRTLPAPRNEESKECSSPKDAQVCSGRQVGAGASPKPEFQTPLLTGTVCPLSTPWPGAQLLQFSSSPASGPAFTSKQVRGPVVRAGMG